MRKFRKIVTLIIKFVIPNQRTMNRSSGTFVIAVRFETSARDRTSRRSFRPQGLFEPGGPKGNVPDIQNHVTT